MTEPSIVAGILVAIITGAVTLWTQRGAARARKQTEAIAARTQDLAEWRALRESAIAEAESLRDDQRELREEIDALRKEIRSLRNEAGESALLLNIASSYIKVLRPLVPKTEHTPPLPDILRVNDIGVI